MSQRPQLIWIAALLAVTLAASPARAEDVRKAVEAANSEFRAAVLAGDAQKLSELYTANARIIPPRAPIASGRAAIAEFWQGMIATNVKDLVLETHDVEAAGGLAIEDGTVIITAADGTTSSSRYVVVWKSEGGTWKLHRDIWNSDR